MRRLSGIKVLLVLALGAAATACSHETQGPAGSASTAEASRRTATTPPPAPSPVSAIPVAPTLIAPRQAAPLRVGDEIDIPAGTVRAGSAPGTAFRDPTTEADLIPVAVPAFRIDRLPYPNDPSQPPRTQVTRAEAEALCENDGKRLCTELEWERACEGDVDQAFPSGATFDLEACSVDATQCASPFDVLALGATLREWTSSPTTTGLGDALRTVAIRGAPINAEPGLHRCAARGAATPETSSQSLGFRCCRGPAPTLAYPIERDRPMFREQRVDLQELRRIISQMPEVARFSSSFMPFDESEVDRALSRGSATRASLLQTGWRVAADVLSWAPKYGEDVWVVAGAASGSGIIIAFYPMPDGTFRHAASFILDDEPMPVAVAYNPDSQRELLWSACWGCGGEGGAITFRDDSRIIVVQR